MEAYPTCREISQTPNGHSLTHSFPSRSAARTDEADPAAIGVAVCAESATLHEVTLFQQTLADIFAQTIN